MVRGNYVRILTTDNDNDVLGLIAGEDHDSGVVNGAIMPA